MWVPQGHLAIPSFLNIDDNVEVIQARAAILFVLPILSKRLWEAMPEDSKRCVESATTAHLGKLETNTVWKAAHANFAAFIASIAA